MTQQSLGKGEQNYTLNWANKKLDKMNSPFSAKKNSPLDNLQGEGPTVTFATGMS